MCPELFYTPRRWPLATHAAFPPLQYSRHDVESSFSSVWRQWNKVPGQIYSFVIVYNPRSIGFCYLWQCCGWADRSWELKVSATIMKPVIPVIYLEVIVLMHALKFGFLTKISQQLTSWWQRPTAVVLAVSSLHFELGVLCNKNLAMLKHVFVFRLLLLCWFLRLPTLEGKTLKGKHKEEIRQG